MATYTLTGTGIQALTVNTTSIHVTITAYPYDPSSGDAHPADYYNVGHLRLGDAVGFFEPINIAGGPQWIGIPGGTTRVGYSLGEAVVQLAEVIGGTPPFGGGAHTLDELADVDLGTLADGQVLTYDSALAQWANETPTGGGGGGSGGALLATTVYNPSPAQGKLANTTTLVDVDATNLAITFSAPASGKIVIHLSALASVTTNGGPAAWWGLRSGTTTVGLPVAVTRGSGNQRVSATFVITGLTPSTSYTYKWAFAVGGTQNGWIDIGGPAMGSTGGPAIMEVWAG